METQSSGESQATVPVKGDTAPAPVLAPAVTPIAKAKSFSEVAVGDTFDGLKIDFIYAATDQYIVFQSKDQLSYDYDGVKFGREATAAFHERIARAEVRLEGAYRERRHQLLGDALVQAFDAEDVNDIAPCFVTFDEFLAANSPVQRVFARTDDFVVFLDRNGELVAEYPEAPKELLPATAEMEKSLQIAKTSLRPMDQPALRQILGNEMAVAFRYGTAGNVAETFAASRAFIASRVQTRNSALYAVTSLGIAVVGAVVLLAVIANASALSWFPNVRQCAIGALGGMTGAWISILQRSGSLQMPDFTPKPQVALQAAVRMILGILFGALVAIAVHGDVAFGSFKSLSALTLISVAAGFSERLIPDLLTNLGTQSGKTAQTGDKPAEHSAAAGGSTTAGASPAPSSASGSTSSAKTEATTVPASS